MALPKLNSVTFELTLPSTGEKVEYRPFLVKEEKALMLAQQSGKEADMLRAVENIIQDCTMGKLKKGTLAFFDIEYVFLQLRAKSVGETVDVLVTCPDDKETKVSVKINLEEVQCVKNVEHKTEFKITDTIGLSMEYPKVSELSLVDSSKAETTFDLIESCIKSIYDEENVYERGDMDKKELREFVESMSHSQFQEIQQFFETMPKVKHSVKVKNPNTGVESEVVIEGMANFF